MLFYRKKPFSHFEGLIEFAHQDKLSESQYFLVIILTQC